MFDQSTSKLSVAVSLLRGGLWLHSGSAGFGSVLPAGFKKTPQVFFLLVPTASYSILGGSQRHTWASVIKKMCFKPWCMFHVCYHSIGQSKSHGHVSKPHSRGWGKFLFHSWRLCGFIKDVVVTKEWRNDNSNPIHHIKLTVNRTKCL